MTTVILALALGFAAGVLSGTFGVGGGILFVPTLTLVVGLSQLGAQATSLAAMIPVVVLGAWRQHRVGAVDWRAATIAGLASGVGVAGGALLADALGDETLRRLFAGLLVVTAAHLAWSASRSPRP
ncbi:MAG TPA: sulfite exporter TauE/SafE family protein [Gaiellaceae bacterium]|nr:sulfite exporter TauE/SafE family protein [Gaiellaceae bacterium]